MNILKKTHTLYIIAGKKIRKQVTACIDPEYEFTLACAAPGYVVIREARVYVTAYKNNGFCKNPIHDARSCSNYRDISIKTYFDGCNTLASCNKRMPVNQSAADNLLGFCKTRFMYKGHVYIHVEYDCAPRELLVCYDHLLLTVVLINGL